MQVLIALFLLINFVHAGEQVQVKAESFEADETKNISIFKGSVHLEKGDDSLKADKVTIYFTKDKRPLRYEATGDVNFKVSVDKKSLYRGKSGKLIYKPSANTYQLFNNVQIEDVRSERKLMGNEITLNLDSGHAKVIGKKKKPVVMTFSVEDEVGEQK